MADLTAWDAVEAYHLPHSSPQCGYLIIEFFKNYVVICRYNVIYATCSSQPSREGSLKAHLRMRLGAHECYVDGGGVTRQDAVRPARLLQVREDLLLQAHLFYRRLNHLESHAFMDHIYLKPCDISSTFFCFLHAEFNPKLSLGFHPSFTTDPNSCSPR